MPEKGIPVAIGGVTYDLCVDLALLAEAEEHFIRRGQEVSLVAAIPKLADTLSALLQVFPCALYAFHPEVSFADAQKLITLGSYTPIIDALAGAWPAISEETKAANNNLCFEFAALAEAAEYFTQRGDVGILPRALRSGLSLANVRKIFPFALHKFRPELSFTAAQQLMTLESVYAVAFGMPKAWESSSEETRTAFVLRLKLCRPSWSEIGHA